MRGMAWCKFFLTLETSQARVRGGRGILNVFNRTLGFATLSDTPDLINFNRRHLHIGIAPLYTRSSVRGGSNGPWNRNATVRLGLSNKSCRPTFHLCRQLQQSQSLKMTQLMSSEHAKEIINNVDSFLFDCDGVLWDGRGTIEGSLDTIKKLKSLGKRVFYVTNNSSLTRADYLKKCENFGFPAEEKDIVCTAYVAAQYLKKINFKGKVYLVGKEESLGKELSNVGISYVGPGPDPLTSTKVEDWLQIKLDPEINCVVVGFDPHISYPKMIKASSYVKNPDCLFIVTNEDGCLPQDSPMCIPGSGSISTPIKLASAREPVVMGKPEVNMMDILKSEHSLDPSRCMMVGDRYDTDIVFAKTCGMKYSLLVLTGVVSRKEVESGEVSASFYADRLGDFGKHL